MNISIIGAGNLATHLAPALAAAGHTIVGVYSRTMESASVLARNLGNEQLATDELELLSTADVYIISVKDDAVESIVERWPEKFRNGIVVHTAGTLPMDLISRASAHFGVLYPMQTFSKNKAVDFSKIPIFIEGNDKTTKDVLTTMASSVSETVIELSSKDRKFLHIAAVFSCNFVNHMIALGYEILEQKGIPPTVLLPLIGETVSKLDSMHPHEAQTGPARRGDRQVIEAHLHELADDKELQELYRKVSESIMTRFQ